MTRASRAVQQESNRGRRQGRADAPINGSQFAAAGNTLALRKNGLLSVLLIANSMKLRFDERRLGLSQVGGALAMDSLGWLLAISVGVVVCQFILLGALLTSDET